MPRLLNVNNYHYRRGGADIVYLEHGAMFERLGWDSAYFAMHHPRNLSTPWSAYFVDEIEWGQAYGPWQRALKAARVVYSWQARQRLRALLARFRPDVAHLHCIYHHLSPAILPELHRAGVPTVMTAHDLKLVCPAYTMLSQGRVCERCRDGAGLQVLRRRCIHDSLAASAVIAAESLLHRALQTYRRHLARIVVPSRFHIAKFVEWGWPAERFAHVPNGIDASRYQPSYDPGKHVLYVGRLAAYKGLATLLQAAQRAAVPLRIAGAGPDEARLRALHAAAGGEVQFLGHREGAALHELMRNARAVVLPTEMYENAPLVVLEAMALGKPVVGARIGGIPELVIHGRTGWTFASGDVNALAATLAEVMAAPDDEVRRRGEAARAAVESDFSAARYRESMCELYRSLGVAA